ncbi:MAG: DUF4199 domain-containing protein [Flavobacteriaceae bacterium]
MDTQKASLKKIALNYGLLLGLASIALSVVTYVMGVHLERPWWASVLGILIMVVLIVYGLKAFKKDSGGFLSLGEAIKVGLAISVIAGIIGAIYNYVFVTVIEPDFVAQMMEVTREQMIEQNPNMTEEQMKMGLSMAEKFMSPGIMAAMAIIFTLFLGFIISLISGLIMKQNRPESYQN